MASQSEKVQRVIEVLNKARSMELHAIHQYMNQHYNLDDMDYGEFASNLKRVAIDEMGHAEQFAERIKELGGEPASDLAAKVEKGQKFEKIYPFDITLEDNTIAEYNKFLGICRECHDSVSATVFQTILEDEQKHHTYFSNINTHISKLGASFLAKMAGTPSDVGGSTLGFVNQATNG